MTFIIICLDKGVFPSARLKAQSPAHHTLIDEGIARHVASLSQYITQFRPHKKPSMNTFLDKKFFAALTMLMMLAGCGGDGEGDLTFLSSGNDGFGRCDSSLNLPSGVLCKTTTVPLSRDGTDRGDIELYTMKVPAEGPTKGQLWLIDGGPGGSGVNFARGSAVFSQFTDAGWELIIPMHRGTGLSSPLTCSNPGFMGACIADLQSKYGDKLNSYSASEAAKDIHDLLTNEDKGLPQYLFGSSYGTYVVQRYLQLFPNAQIAGAILDGVLDLNSDMENQLVHGDRYVRELLELCDENTLCAEAMEGSATAALKKALDNIENQSCDVITLNRQESESILYNTLDSSLRVLAMPLIAMTSRCNEADKTTLQHALPALYDYYDSSSSDLNGLLYYNVFAIDLYHPDSTTLAPDTQSEDVLLQLSSATDRLFENLARWSALVLPGDYSRVVGETQTPVLILQGGLDLRTVKEWAEQANIGISSPQKTYAFFPYAGHGTGSYTETPNGENCSFGILEQFLKDPDQQLDLSCIDNTQKPDFGFSSTWSKWLSNTVFGVENPWTDL